MIHEIVACLWQAIAFSMTVLTVVEAREGYQRPNHNFCLFDYKLLLVFSTECQIAIRQSFDSLTDVLPAIKFLLVIKLQGCIRLLN